MNADEKAVAECPFCGNHVQSKRIATTSGSVFLTVCSKCSALGPQCNTSKAEALAAFTNPKHLAARIRADAERETERLRKAMISTSISVRAAFGINADPELKPWNRQHLCDFLDGIADTIDAALKRDA